MQKITLMKHQQDALHFLKQRNGGLLSLPCGAGKTLITLKYIASLTASDTDPNRVLIVCPRSLIGSWLAENKKWGILKEIEPVIGKDRKEKWDWILAGGMGVFITSYETLLADYKKHKQIRRVEWGVVVGDESSKIKSPTAKISKMFMLLKSKRKVLLNATVIENSVGDLWTQAESIEPNVLYGNFYKFRAIHAVMNQYFPGIQYWRDKEEIIRRVSHLIYTVPKEDVLSRLPPITEQILPVLMSAQQEKTYIKVRDELLLEINGETEVVGNVLTKLMRLRQTTNGLWAFGGDDKSGKVDALQELLSQFGNEKSIIFSQFSETVCALQRALRVRHAITGATCKRDEVIDDWRKTGTALLGTSALMKGHNLQDARFVVFVDLPWTYAMYEQAFSRAWRTGQKNPVTVYTLEAEGTVDTQVRKLVFNKKQDGDMLKRLTIKDIKDLIIC